MRREDEEEVSEKRERERGGGLMCVGFEKSKK